MVFASKIVPPQKNEKLPVGLPWRICACHGIGDGACFPWIILSNPVVAVMAFFIHAGIVAHPDPPPPGAAVVVACLHWHTVQNCVFTLDPQQSPFHEGT